MSDSLREQLLQAGFKQTRKEPPKKKPRPAGPKSGGGPRPSGASKGSGDGRRKAATSDEQAKKMAQQAAVQQRKVIKAQIKGLVEDSAIKEYAGDVAYRYTLQNRIRELHISEPVRQQLMSGALVITRLNGGTYLVPDTTADQIRKLNPDWAIVTPTDAKTDNPEGYDDFPIPDDLVW